MEPDEEVRRLHDALATGGLAAALDDPTGLALTALDHLPYMVWMKDTAGVFLVANEPFARAAGHAREAILGRTDLDLWPEELALRYRADDQAVISTGQKVAVEEPIAEATGTRWFETFKAPVMGPGGTIVGTVGLARDITARKDSEEHRRMVEARIQHAQKLESLGVLAGGIAHDFNNLLVGVLSNAELAIRELRSLPSAARVIERVENVRMAALHAAELTRQMLAYSGRAAAERRLIALDDVIRDSLQLLQASILKKASLRCELGADVGVVNADSGQLRQVIMNLVTNASDALEDEPGTIRVETGTRTITETSPARDQPPLDPGAYVYVRVSDDGCGMSHETRARLFDPFYTTKFTGRGLGLAAVQGIVWGHQGRITVDSELGRGSTFEVLLPASEGAPAERRDTDSGGASEEWRGSGVALVVDDDPQVLTVMKAVLEELGFAVLTAASGADAIATYREVPDSIAIVLLDMTMPDLSGARVFDRLREIRSDARVVICSGYDERDARSRLTGEEGAFFLQKPFSFERARDVLRDALRDGDGGDDGGAGPRTVAGSGTVSGE